MPIDVSLTGSGMLVQPIPRPASMDLSDSTPMPEAQLATPGATFSFIALQRS